MMFLVDHAPRKTIGLVSENCATKERSARLWVFPLFRKLDWVCNWWNLEVYIVCVYIIYGVVAIDCNGCFSMECSLAICDIIVPTASAKL